MGKLDSLTQILRCPKCKTNVKEGPENLSCEKCKLNFPFIGGIPWFFQHPSSTLLQWKARSQANLHTFIREAEVIEDELRTVDLLPETKNRLELMAEGCRQNAKSIEQLLSPLLDQQPSNLPLIQALAEKVPMNQAIESYYTNIFRDWVWENGENKKSLEIITNNLPLANLKGKRIVILGAGAGRLASDIHLKFKPAHTVLVDINPLMLLLAKKVISGQTITLYEFPQTPLTAEQSAVKGDCQSKTPIKKDFDFIFADATNLPIADKSIDLIITPWLIDIIPQDLPDFAKRINMCLKKGGLWINFGSLHFARRKYSQLYSAEETLKIIGEAGFKIKDSGRTELPYLQSPNCGYGRIEKVFHFRAEKEKDSKVPKRFKMLPDWLTDTSLPIPKDPAFAEAISRFQIHYNMLALVDGTRCADGIAPILAKQFQISEVEAIEAFVSFMTDFFERNIMS